MKQYNCPDCENTDTCDNCQRTIKMTTTVAFNDYGRKLFEEKFLDINAVPLPCRGCSNHPYNGGSGICHCILGIQTIY